MFSFNQSKDTKKKVPEEDAPKDTKKKAPGPSQEEYADLQNGMLLTYIMFVSVCCLCACLI